MSRLPSSESPRYPVGRATSGWREWLLRCGFGAGVCIHTGEVCVQTGEIVTDLLCEQVGEGVGELGGVGGLWRGRCL